MAGYKVMKKLPMGKGLSMSILHDASQPEDSLGRWAGQIEAEGNPDDDEISVPVHWHKKHTERHLVIEGRVEFTINGVTRIFTQGEETYIPPYTLHGIRGFRGERLVIREVADPPGNYKAEWFNDFLVDQHYKSFWYSMRSFYDGDGYISLPLYFRFFDVAFINIFGGLAKLFLPATEPLERRE